MTEAEDRHSRQRREVTGLGAAVAVVATETLLVYPLREVAPAVSLGVVYLLGVLLIASVWTLRLGLFTALLSALAFNFFHIEPTGRLDVASAPNLVALAVFFVVALVAAELAGRARLREREADRRRAEADLAAEMARLLLRGRDLRGELSVVAQRIAATLGLGSAAIELGTREPDERRLAFPLRDGPRLLATLLVPRATDEATLARLQERIIPSLEALLAAALEREALLGDRVETVALRRTDTLKTALLRAVSHDLRSPLTAIRTAAEPLLSGRLPAAEREELASIVIAESERLARMIDDLLDLSRIEAGAAQASPVECDLAEVLEAAAEELDPGGERLRLQLPADLPALEADPAQLERAFANILANSVRHSGGHPVMVRAQALHDRLVTRVVDRGPGIPAAQRERIFEPFYRGEDTAGGPRGSGLGLAIARGFVTANDGSIGVESLPGQGTTFVVELPLPSGGRGSLPAVAERSA
ncbi:DUF4118 domain-containing protein [Thermoleophilia bacterium SCSIO 60948]|nr:DUF4118 domain-containing protein [Thermoleophilia bacterium SCSIO 60948]